VKSVNGATQVIIIDEGKQVAWDVQAGPSDGSRTQILAGLDEGQLVVSAQRSRAAAGQSQRRQNSPALPFMPGMR